MTSIARWGSTLAVFLVSCVMLTGAAAPANASIQPIPIDADWVAGWQADLDTLETEMPRIHPDLFHTVPAEEFHRHVERIRESLPRLHQHEAVMELAALVASVGDGHTRLTLPLDPEMDFFQGHSTTPDANVPGTPFHQFPIRFYDFADGTFIQQIDREHAAAAGARLLSIDGHSIGEIRAQVAPFVEHDNDSQIRDHLPERLVVPEILHAWGLIEDMNRVTFGIRRPDGTETTVAMEALDPGRSVEWVDARDTTATPLYLRDPDGNYWFEYLPESRTVFFQYNTCEDGGDESIPDFAGRLFDFIEANPVDQLVIDLRWNRGGDNTRNRPFVHGLICCSKLQSIGSLYAIVGRATFSAAMSFALDLEQETPVIFVGEPTGARPNHYGDSRKLTLPNTGLTVRTSTLYWQGSNPKDFRDAIHPQIPAEMTARDYGENRDPAMEAALACAADLRGDGPGAGSEPDELVRAAPRSGLPRPSGDWTGLLSLGYEQIPVAVHFGDRPSADVPAEGGASDTWDVTLDLPSEDAFGLAVQDLEYDGGILRFGLDLGEIVPFEGRVNGARILGRFVLSGREWLFLLER